MSIYLSTIIIIFVVMSCGIVVDRIYRGFAARNPQLGPFRDTDKCGSCSAGSGCSDASDVADAAEHEKPAAAPRG